MERSHPDGSASAPGRLVVREPDAREWPLIRGMRLVALADSPRAFVPNGDEPTWTASDWVATFAAGPWVVAEIDGQPVGLAHLTRTEAEPPHIEAVWTHPPHRRRGIARALVTRLIELAVLDGDRELLVWVIEPNEVARQAYESLGFSPTGERQVVAGMGVLEERLRLPVRPIESPARPPV